MVEETNLSLEHQIIHRQKVVLSLNSNNSSKLQALPILEISWVKWHKEWILISIECKLIPLIEIEWTKFNNKCLVWWLKACSNIVNKCSQIHSIGQIWWTWLNNFNNNFIKWVKCFFVIVVDRPQIFHVHKNSCKNFKNTWRKEVKSWEKMGMKPQYVAFVNCNSWLMMMFMNYLHANINSIQIALNHGLHKRVFALFVEVKCLSNGLKNEKMKEIL